MTQKFATIALVGAPNAGKSTLTNALLGQKITITSPKVQTTRNCIKAILVEDNTQIVILDTPGVFLPKSNKILERIIVKSAWQGIRSADFVYFLIDATKGLDPQNYNILKQLQNDGFTPTVIINKIDLVKKNELLTIIQRVSEHGLEEIFMISATNQDGLDQLKQNIITKCPKNPWQYDPDHITDAPMRAIAAEITREKLFLYLNQEIPYSTNVKTDSYQIENNQITIYQTIFVVKESQKAIILGKNGSLIKKIGLEARKDIAKIAGMKTSLYLFVKVKKDWMNHLKNYEMIDIEKIPK